MTKLPNQRQNDACQGKYEHGKTKQDGVTNDKKCQSQQSMTHLIANMNIKRQKRVCHE